MKLAHWLLMGRLLHLVQREGNWAEPQPAQAHPRCTNITTLGLAYGMSRTSVCLSVVCNVAAP